MKSFEKQQRKNNTFSNPEKSPLTSWKTNQLFVSDFWIILVVDNNNTSTW